jgi:cell division protein FtsW
MTSIDLTGDVARPHRRPLHERRQQALQRLQVSTERRQRRRLPVLLGRERLRFWDVPEGPAPIGFYVIAVVVTVFLMLGLVMVLSATAQTQAQRGRSPYFLFNRQLMWAGIGMVGLVVALRINLLWLRRLAVPTLVVAGVGMLAPFSPIGVTLNDARAWIAFGDFTLQPSEFLKLAVVVFAADLLVRRKDDLSDVRRSLKPLLLLAGFAAGTCLAQTDLGSAVVMAAIVLVVAFIGAVPLAPMVGATLMSVAAAVAFVVSSQRRIDRFTAFLDITGHRDRLSYQTYQGFLAIADGGLTGSGVGAGNSKLGYLPLAHSDFIFAVIADELGFVGTLAVLGGFALLVWFGIQAALAAPDRFGMLLAGGIAAWFGVQTIVNTGGVSGLLPVTGLTLPFFSAGGSSLFVSMTAAGLLLNVARRGRISTTIDERAHPD